MVIIKIVQRLLYNYTKLFTIYLSEYGCNYEYYGEYSGEESEQPGKYESSSPQSSSKTALDSS